VRFAGYNSATKLHDLALIQTETKITLSEGVNCEFYEEADTRPDEGLIMGWGATFVSCSITKWS